MTSPIGARAAVLVSLLVLAAAGASRADDCELPAHVRGSRPGEGGGATEVRIGLLLLDVVGVNDRDQSITVDFNVNLRWTDPRLARGADGPKVCFAAVED